MKNQVAVLLLLLLLPGIFLFTGISFQRSHFANDPDYIYLMNALSICRGKDVGHVDNPGTPVMELMAAVISVHHYFDPSETEPLEISVARNPDKYVEISRKIFILLISLVLVLTAWVIFTISQSVWLALVFQFTPFLSVNLMEHAWTKTSPEPLLILITFLLVMLLMNFYFDTKKSRKRYPFWFGVISGIGLATKATFLPLVIIPFFLLKRLKTNAIYLLVAIGVFFLSTSPAHNEYPKMVRWFRGLITHQGIYGQGEKGFPEIGNYISSMGQVIINNIPFSIGFFFLLVLLLLSGFIFRKTVKNKQHQRLSWALVISGFIGILIVAKHYHANHYLMPLLALTGLYYIMVFLQIREILRISKVLPLLSAAFLMIFFSVLLFKYVPELQLKYKGYDHTNREYEKVEHLIHCSFSDYTGLIYYPNSLNKKSALKFGNSYSKLNNQDVLTRVYPNAYFVNMFYGTMEGWHKPVTIEDIFSKHGYKLFLKGRPLTGNNHSFINNLGLSFKPVFEGQFQALYVLDTSALQGVFRQKALAYTNTITCGAESLSFGKQNFTEGPYLFSTAESRTTEFVRTGVYAVKLDDPVEYSMRFELEGLTPGQQVECSVWRYPGDNNGYIVATTQETEPFYVATNNPVTTERSGWQKLHLEFEAPDLPAGEKLIIYLWNSGDNVVYFDDMTIRTKRL